MAAVAAAAAAAAGGTAPVRRPSLLQTASGKGGRFRGSTSKGMSVLQGGGRAAAAAAAAPVVPFRASPFLAGEPGWRWRTSSEEAVEEDVCPAGVEQQQRVRKQRLAAQRTPFCCGQPARGRTTRRKHVEARAWAGGQDQEDTASWPPPAAATPPSSPRQGSRARRRAPPPERHRDCSRRQKMMRSPSWTVLLSSPCEPR